MNMNIKESIREKFYEQICKDYNCTKEQLLSKENVFNSLKLIDGRRQFKDDISILKILCINGKMVCMCTDEIRSEAEELLKSIPGAWLSDPKDVGRVNELLLKHGHKVEDFHHFYLPLNVEGIGEGELETIKEGLELKWYDEKGVESFRGDKRFMNALSFIPTAPDMVAVAALKEGQFLGMAGASKDCEDLWQIGIDVFPEARGRNIGPLLVILLKRRILEMGKVPFYGTAESNIQSQKVAVKSGFYPFWAELISSPLELQNERFPKEFT